jgi:hypothetical protein
MSMPCEKRRLPSKKMRRAKILGESPWPSSTLNRTTPIAPTLGGRKAGVEARALVVIARLPVIAASPAARPLSRVAEGLADAPKAAATALVAATTPYIPFP